MEYHLAGLFNFAHIKIYLCLTVNVINKAQLDRCVLLSGRCELPSWNNEYQLGPCASQQHGNHICLPSKHFVRRQHFVPSWPRSELGPITNHNACLICESFNNSSCGLLVLVLCICGYEGIRSAHNLFLLARTSR